MAAFFVIMDGDIVGECIRAVTEAKGLVSQLTGHRTGCRRNGLSAFRPLDVSPRQCTAMLNTSGMWNSAGDIFGGRRILCN